MIERLELRNFTAFNQVVLDLSPKINVIIGENGTGKTHLLKVGYCLCGALSESSGKHTNSKKAVKEVLTQKLVRLFMPMDDKLGKMHRRGGSESAMLLAEFATGERVQAGFGSRSTWLDIVAEKTSVTAEQKAIFIPTKEVLSLVRGMSAADHDQATVERIFDDGYVDLARALIRPGCDDPETRIDLDPRFGSIVPRLVELIGGRYEFLDGSFCFQAGKYVEKVDPDRSESAAARMYQDSTVTRFVATKDPMYSSAMTAEGFRKIGILHRLLSNCSLNPGAGGPLFWDEPESNLNPKLMRHLVEVLLELSRNGQQVILATHDYVLLKWFDLLIDKGKDDQVRFHSLYTDQSNNEITVDSVDDYTLIRKSAISDAFAELYDEDVKRALN